MNRIFKLLLIIILSIVALSFVFIVYSIFAVK